MEWLKAVVARLRKDVFQQLASINKLGKAENPPFRWI